MVISVVISKKLNIGVMLNRLIHIRVFEVGATAEEIYSVFLTLGIES